MKARAAKAAVGEPVALRFSVTDDSGSTRENITIWKGEKRQQLIARKTFEPTPESGDERTTTLEVAELGKWKSKPGKYRWCVRAFDEAGNKSKVACANLTITKAGSGGTSSGGSTAEEPATSGDGLRRRPRRATDGRRRLLRDDGSDRRRVERGLRLHRVARLPRGARAGTAACREAFPSPCQQPLTSRTRRRSTTTPRGSHAHEVAALRHAADAVFFGEDDREGALEGAHALLSGTLAHEDRLGPEVAEAIAGLLDGVQPVLTTA